MYNFICLGKTADGLVSVERHLHTTWELIYVRVGVGCFWQDSGCVPFAPGDIIIVPPNHLHYETSENGYGNYYMFFRDFYIPDTTGTAFVLHDTADGSVSSLLRLMHHVREDDVDQHLTASLFECLHQYIRILLSNDRNLSAAERFKRIIEENFSDPAYTLEPDDETEYCSDHLRRLFKLSFGMTPLRYLIMLRINKAKQLMHDNKSGSASLKQIAFDSGYNDYYYFSRQFKKETGFSPKEWNELATYPGKYVNR